MTASDFAMGEKLGGGLVAQVFSAIHKASRLEVALKIYRKSMLPVRCHTHALSQLYSSTCMLLTYRTSGTTTSSGVSWQSIWESTIRRCCPCMLPSR